MLHGEEAKIKLTPLRSGDCSGKVIASLVHRYTRVMKANYNLKTDSKIVIIESVGLNAKKLNPNLNKLLKLGFFQNVSAIVFGHITKTKDDQKKIDAVLKKFTKIMFQFILDFHFGIMPNI
jgi:muramoyltetrapeptide carboxypeptidase LdcA involved in peptidoglycan recycling